MERSQHGCPQGRAQEAGGGEQQKGGEQDLEEETLVVDGALLPLCHLKTLLSVLGPPLR